MFVIEIRHSILDSINNKLQQPESAAGVLEYAMNLHRADLVGTLDMLQTS